MKYLYILSFSLLAFACGNKKSEVQQQAELGDDLFVDYVLSTREEVKEEVLVPFSKDRKLRFLYATNGGLRAYYDDGTLVGCSRCDLMKENLEAMQEMEPMGTYTIDSNGVLLWGTGLDTPDMEDPSWDDGSWAMIDYQWQFVPKGMEDANIKVPTASFNLTDVGVELYLYGNVLGDDEAISLHVDWYQLSHIAESHNFLREKISVSLDSFYWDCGDENLPYVKSDSKNEGLILYRGIVTKDESKEVPSIEVEILNVTPTKKYTFSFGSQEYTLRAEGFPASTDGDLYKNYKLYLSLGDKEQLLMSIPSFDQSVVTIQFIGDLDGDGKPDFIFETSRHYESNESTLYLSSFAKDDELVKCVAQNRYGLFC